MSRLLKLLAAGVALAATSYGLAQSNSGARLPPDVDAESFSRLPALHRDDLNAEGQRAYDHVVGDGARPLTGPAAVSMYSPKVAEVFHTLNQYLRNGAIPARYFEVAVLHAAWEFEQPYEWSGHEPAARRVGVPDAVIDTIKYDREPQGLEKKDELIIRFGRALFRDHKVDSELYAEVVEHFGQQGMVELATIMGDYVMVGLVLTAADQHLPAGRPNTLPAREVQSGEPRARASARSPRRRPPRSAPPSLAAGASSAPVRATLHSSPAAPRCRRLKNRS